MEATQSLTMELLAKKSNRIPPPQRMYIEMVVTTTEWFAGCQDGASAEPPRTTCGALQWFFAFHEQFFNHFAAIWIAVFITHFSQPFYSFVAVLRYISDV